MAYKDFKELFSICFLTPKKIWSSFLESFKTSKITFFFQVINCSFIIYICIWVLPKVVANYETLVVFLKTLEASYVALLVLFVWFVLWILGSVKSLGFEVLFETNRTVTLVITSICLLILCLDRFFYEKAKDFTKRMLKYDSK